MWGTLLWGWWWGEQWLQVSLTKYIRFYVFEDLHSQALEFEFWGVGNKIENPSPWEIIDLLVAPGTNHSLGYLVGGGREESECREVCMQSKGVQHWQLGFKESKHGTPSLEVSLERKGLYMILQKERENKWDLALRVSKCRRPPLSHHAGSVSKNDTMFQQEGGAVIDWWTVTLAWFWYRSQLLPHFPFWDV